MQRLLVAKAQEGQAVDEQEIASLYFKSADFCNLYETGVEDLREANLRAGGLRHAVMQSELTFSRVHMQASIP